MIVRTIVGLLAALLAGEVGQGGETDGRCGQRETATIDSTLPAGDWQRVGGTTAMPCRQGCLYDETSMRLPSGSRQ